MIRLICSVNKRPLNWSLSAIKGVGASITSVITDAIKAKVGNSFRGAAFPFRVLRVTKWIFN